MKRLYVSALSIGALTATYAQEVVWQKDIKSSTQDFLSQVITTIDQQYLITGSSIQSKKLSHHININTYHYFFNEELFSCFLSNNFKVGNSFF